MWCLVDGAADFLHPIESWGRYGLVGVHTCLRLTGHLSGMESSARRYLLSILGGLTLSLSIMIAIERSAWILEWTTPLHVGPSSGSTIQLLLTVTRF